MKAITMAHHTASYCRICTTALLRLAGALALYYLFGLLADNSYASDFSSKPLESSHGSVWLKSGDGSYRNALLLDTEVDFDVSGMIARARVKQTFSNTIDIWTEGIYVFPLPDDAAVDHFRLHAGGRIIEGRIQERSHARKTYETAKQNGQRAGLIEQQRANVFTTSLANIAPGETITVELEYQQTLVYDNGSYRLRFPLVTGPRYQASAPSRAAADSATDVSTAVSDRITNPVYIHVSLDAGTALTSLDSSYHEIDVRQTDSHRYSIALAADRVSADRDFELVWRLALEHQPRAAAFSEVQNGDEYLLLSILPPELQSLGQQSLPRDVIFVLDVSGSMSGASIEQARASLVRALGRLRPQDRFNLIWFNDRAERLYTQARPASDHNTRYASRIVDKLHAGGGTVMLPALALALNQQPEPARLRQIIFLTDGNVDNENELFTLIRDRLGENRLFTVGIGSAPNSHFMHKAARAGRGTFTYIGDINEVGDKTDALLKKLESPALVNIDVRLEGRQVEILPSPVPDLYLGEPLTLLIRGRQLGEHLSIYGDFGESAWQQRVALDRSIDHPGIRTAWAGHKIALLTEQYHDVESTVQRDSIKRKIITTSMEHRLLSRFTSLVAVDVTPVNSSGLFYSEKLKTNLPHGWKRSQLDQPAAQQMLAQLRLPQTATPAFLHLMTAAMLFALAMVFYLWRKLL